LGDFSFGVQGRQARDREEIYDEDRREQLPIEALGMEGISKNMLFFQKTI
jgi:hypothetical protein